MRREFLIVNPSWCVTYGDFAEQRNQLELRLVLIGIVLAVPVVYFAMNRWLDTFPYHAEIGVSTFIVAGVLALLIAFLTVCYQSVRAAISNPVKSLRYE